MLLNRHLFISFKTPGFVYTICTLLYLFSLGELVTPHITGSEKSFALRNQNVIFLQIKAEIL